MVYLHNTYMPGHMPIHQALQRIYGVGRSCALNVCAMCGVSASTRVKDLHTYQLEALGDWIDQLYVTQSNLKRKVRTNMERLVKIGCYRGYRISLGYPGRGQQTQTNAQTARRLRYLKRLTKN